MRVSRSKKLEYDPAELDDLILNPAVGSGVSSHLLEPQPQAPSLDPKQQHKPEPEQEHKSAETKRVRRNIHPAPIGLAPIGATPTVVKPLGSSPTAPEPIGDLPDIASVLAELEAERRPVSKGKIVRALRVEDGHSQTQDSLYWYLWRAGRPAKGSRSRFVQAGYGQIQTELGLNRSNVQDAIRDLVRKLSLRVVKQSTVGSSTIYEVFSCEDILARRRAEGLLWVRKYGKRRADLLTMPDSPPIGLMPIGPAPIGMENVGIRPSVGVKPTDPVGFTPIEPVGLTPTHLSNEQVEQTTSTADLAVAVRAHGVDLDLAAVDRISRECRAMMPDVRLAEIAALFALHYFGLHRRGSARNPVGVMLADFSTWFSADRVEALRRQKQPTMEEPPEPELEVDPHEAIRRMFSGEG
jgi:hypothetical protein